MKKKMNPPTSLLALAFSLPFMSSSMAATVFEIVTPTNLQGWGQTDTRPGGAAAITVAEPRNGDGSVMLTRSGPDTAKADWATGWNADTNKYGVTSSLLSLNQWSFDYKRSSLSLDGANQSPAIRVYFANDTNNDSVYDQVGSLVWEHAYQGQGNTPTDNWQVVDLMTQKFWMRAGTSNLDVAGGFLTLADWFNPAVTKPVGAFTLTMDTDALGVQMSVGSGVTGTTITAVDNHSMRFGNGNTVVSNFEPDPIPEPGATALMLLGALGTMRRTRK